MAVELRHMALDRLGVLMVAVGLLLAGCNTTPVSEPLVEEEIDIAATDIRHKLANNLSIENLTRLPWRAAWRPWCAARAWRRLPGTLLSAIS